MVFLAVGPGDDVEAWCTRCRMNLNHRVVAVVGNEISRVICLTCGSDHKYRPAKGEVSSEQKRTGKKAVPAPRTPRGSSSRAASRALGEWSTFMKEMPDGLSPKPYLATQGYEAGEYVEHPLLGTGKVLEILGRERIQVIFKEGRKVLVCNRPIK